MALDQMSGERTVDLTARVKADLLRFIADNRLKTGGKLPPVEQLCQKFAVSRTVVREAIASLKAEGRLRSLRGSGVYVAEPDGRAGGSAMFMAAPQEIGDVLEFMEFRIAVEVEAAGLAAERRTETNLLRMGQAMTQFSSLMTGNGLASSADRAFHGAIADAANNPRFRLFVDAMGERLIPRRALGASFADDKDRSDFLETIEIEHQRIFDAIHDREPDKARLAMRRHLEDGRRRYRDWSVAHEPPRTVT
jgi:GntR family transcriptional repressor for pyruvate dehydrogenase complex